MKYHQQTSIRLALNYLTTEFFRRYPMPLHSFDVQIPIPLHPVRLRERGFNQARLIAEVIKERHGIPIQEKGLVRVRATDPQSSLGQKDRWTNMEGAFRMEKNFDVKERSVLLIDDLLTTGATASNAARALKDAGAKRVGLYVVSLTPLSPQR
jgi:ComF family protein